MRAAFAALLLAGCSQAQPAQDRPTVVVATGLPLFWGEGSVTDVLSGASQRSPLITSLEKSWTIEPADILRRKQLSRIDRLMLIQPQALTPTELVEVDRWVRRGGRILILADPDLRWSSTFPEGDPRRPPTASLLGPLLTHWGVELTPPAGLSPAAETIEGLNVIFDSPGTWELKNDDCTSITRRIARCVIGKGEAILVADVDFADPKWTAATSGRNVAALDSLMRNFWAETSSEKMEQEKNKPPG